MLQNQILNFNTNIFEDREEAGRRLAKLLERYRRQNPLILALPRGGVVVGHEVAKALDTPFDILISRKIGAPFNKEFGIGAISEGNIVVLKHQIIKELGISNKTLESLIDEEREEIKRRINLYRENRPMIPVYNKTVIIVDDGLATGVTAEAAIESIIRLKPKQIIYAAPVCSEEAARTLKEQIESIVCIITPYDLSAIGSYYQTFPQVTDEEVLDIMKKDKNRQKDKLL